MNQSTDLLGSLELMGSNGPAAVPPSQGGIESVHWDVSFALTHKAFPLVNVGMSRYAFECHSLQRIDWIEHRVVSV